MTGVDWLSRWPLWIAPFWIALFLCPAVGRAQLNKPTVLPVAPTRSLDTTTRKLPLLNRPLKLEDFAGMVPSPLVKEQMAEAHEFLQNAPSNGQPPSQRTEVYLGRTKTTLQVAFLCFDTTPGSIRRHLARRENLQADDHVGLLLDAFADRRHGVLFEVNPMGVQADASWTEGNDPDYSYDQVWDSAAQVNGRGWIALMSIPFASLRYRTGGLPWGAVLMRTLPRNSELDAWPAISADISGTLTQEGQLTGIEAGTGSRNIQLNPYGLLQNVHELNTLDANDPYFSSRRIEGTAGGEAKAIIKDSIVLDGTINPDFSQVESNQPQFTVNQRFPVYFPELRPFFLENANYFNTPINLVYTRNIIYPDLGGRVTGKINHTNVGILAIDDREPGETVSEGDPLFEKKAFYGVGRVSQDIGKDSSVGGIYTDQEFAGSWNRIGGLDFVAKLNKNWTVNGQSVESSTRALDGTYSAGPASKIQVVREGHAFNFQNTYRDYSQGFQTQVGFLSTTAFRQDGEHLTYQWYPKHGRVQNYGIEEQTQVAFDRLGNRLYHYSQFDPFVQLARKTTFASLFGQNSDTLGPSSYPTLSDYKDFTENYLGFTLRSAPMPQLNFNVVALRGGNVNYNPVSPAAPNLLDQDYLQAYITLQPVGSLTIDNTYLLDRDFRTRGGPFVYESQTLRTKINYQFTRALSARVIVEYDSTLVNAEQTSLPRTKQVQTQALLTWLPHPGTAIYLGYNNDLQNLNHTLCTKIAATCEPNQPILPRGTGYLNDGRQFFVKASYLLRF